MSERMGALYSPEQGVLHGPRRTLFADVERCSPWRCSEVQCAMRVMRLFLCTDCCAAIAVLLDIAHVHCARIAETDVWRINTC
jgi:hypothetical protein